MPCDNCKFYQFEDVPVEPDTDSTGEFFGFEKVYLCAGSGDDECPAEAIFNPDHPDYKGDGD